MHLRQIFDANCRGPVWKTVDAVKGYDKAASS